MKELSEKGKNKDISEPMPTEDKKLFSARDVANSYVEGFKDGYIQARQDLMENQHHGPDESPEVG
ncbi:hypothetical protein [uncultured Methanobacterium sp.]|uniref:hypothetical protein n=1 Tax=uncultured Methanobacterium sp. TaxID=176306 RepID=UPI002AA7F54A|nr:hypothetical protein [uncultured Methanobacterium sp.]